MTYWPSHNWTFSGLQATSEDSSFVLTKKSWYLSNYQHNCDLWCTFQKSIWRNFKEFWWSTLWTKRWVRLKRKKAETATQSIQIHQSPNKTLIHRKVSFLSRDNFDLLICSQSLIWETSLKSLVLTKLLQKIRRKLPPAKQLISSRLPAKLIINTTKLLPKGSLPKKKLQILRHCLN